MWPICTVLGSLVAAHDPALQASNAAARVDHLRLAIRLLTLVVAAGDVSLVDLEADPEEHVEEVVVAVAAPLQRRAAAQVGSSGSGRSWAAGVVVDRDHRDLVRDPRRMPPRDWSGARLQLVLAAVDVAGMGLLPRRDRESPHCTDSRCAPRGCRTRSRASRRIPGLSGQRGMIARLFVVEHRVLRQELVGNPAIASRRSRRSCSSRSCRRRPSNDWGKVTGSAPQPADGGTDAWMGRRRPWHRPRPSTSASPNTPATKVSNVCSVVAFTPWAPVGDWQPSRCSRPTGAGIDVPLDVRVLRADEVDVVQIRRRPRPRTPTSPSVWGTLTAQVVLDDDGTGLGDRVGAVLRLSLACPTRSRHR